MFIGWKKSIFETEEQKKREERATTQKMQFISFDDKNQTAIVKSSNSPSEYETSLFSCSCKDFIDRKKPCKHMYFLNFEIEKRKLSPFDRLVELPSSFIVIDTETSGLDSSKDELLEVAAIKISNGTVIDSFSSLIKNKKTISTEASKVNHITEELLKDAPEADDVLKRFKDFIGNDLIVGHNVTFDLRFLGQYFDTLFDEDFECKYLDTMQIAKSALKESGQKYKLSSLSEQFDIKTENSHRALSDCNTTFEVLKKLVFYVETIDTYKNDFKFSNYKTKKANNLGSSYVIRFNANDLFEQKVEEAATQKSPIVLTEPKKTDSIPVKPQFDVAKEKKERVSPQKQAKKKKSKTIALILAIFLGPYGGHQFYIGKIGKGILYLFTAGLFGIGWISDIVLIITNKFTDKHGHLLIARKKKNINSKATISK